MVLVSFTPNIQRHVSCPEIETEALTVRQALDAAFAANEKARGYVLDEQGALRKHMAIFIDGRPIKDRVNLSDRVAPSGRIDVFQALSGG